MNEIIYVYLSGSIKKGKDDSRNSFWMDSDMEYLQSVLNPIKIIFLNPGIRSKTDNVADGFSTFGHDLFQVYCSDVVLVDARDRRGIGIGIEMALAKNYNIPVLSLTERNSYYHKDKLEYLGHIVEPFIHPFIESLSDGVVLSLEEAALWLKDYKNASRNKIIDKEVFTNGMKHYLYNNLKKDPFMYDIITGDENKMKLVKSLPDISQDFLDNLK